MAVTLGTIAQLVAKITADDSGLNAALGKANATINNFAKDVTNRMADSAKAPLATMGEKLSEVGAKFRSVGMEMTAGITLPFVGLIKAGSDFETTMTQVANNTSLTNAEIKMMGDTVKKLGAESGASFTELAQGFMHITNFGFTAAQSTGILRAAMESAQATGGDVGKTAEILANVMHEFGLKTNQAAAAMNMLHVEANKGNMTLEQLVDAGGPAFAMAANLGVSINETAAAMAALTQHGFTAAEAATQVRNIMEHIAQPAGKVRDLIDDLSQKTGVNLVRDFSVAGLQGKGLAGVLDDIKEAAKRSGMNLSDLTMKLVPAMRGGIGAMALGGTAAKDFADRLLDANNAMSGKLSPTSAQFAKQQQTLAAEVAKAKNELVLLGADIERILLPALRPAIDAVSRMLTWFSKLPEPVKQTVVVLAAIAAAAGPVLMVLGSLASAIGSIISVASTAGPILSGVAAALSGPVGWAIAAAVAGIVGLYLAWKNNWGGIRDKTMEFVAWISPYLAEAWDAIKTVAVQVWGAVSQFLKDVWPPIRDIIRTTWEAIRIDLTQAFDLIQILFAGTWGNIVQILRGVWEVIKGVVEVAWAVVAGIITVGLKLLTGDWKGAWESLQHYAALAWDGIKNILDGTLRAVVNLIMVQAKMLFNVGQDYIMGFVNGIRSNIANVTQAAQDVANAASNTVRAVLGIHSPSTILHAIGLQTAEGMANGLRAGKGQISNAAREMAQAALEATKEVRDKIYAMTHSSFDVQRKEAWGTRQENLHKGADYGDTQRLYSLTLDKINREQAAQTSKMVSGPVDAVSRAMSNASNALGQFNAQMAERMKQASAAIGSVLNALSSSESEFSAQLNRNLAEQKRLTDERNEYDLRMGNISLQQYRQYLAQKLQGLQEYSDEWMRLMLQIKDADTKLQDDREKQEKERQDRWAATWKPLVDGIHSIFSRAFDDIFRNGFQGFFTNIVTGFQQMLEQMAAEYLASQLTKVIMNGLDSLFGLSGSSSFSGIFGGGRASGGSVSGGQAYLVGENGPEMFVPKNSGSIAPNSALAGAGGHTFVFNITTPDVQSFSRAQGQLMAQAAQHLDYWKKRNG